MNGNTQGQEHKPQPAQSSTSIPRTMQGGYQPTASGDVDVAALKPPRGGSAIESPQSSSEADQSK